MRVPGGWASDVDTGNPAPRLPVPPRGAPFHEIRDRRHWKSSVERLQHAKSKAGSLSCLRDTPQDQPIIHEISSAIPSVSLSSVQAWLALFVPRRIARQTPCIQSGSPTSGRSRPESRAESAGMPDRVARCSSTRNCTYVNVEAEVISGALRGAFGLRISCVPLHRTIK